MPRPRAARETARTPTLLSQPGRDRGCGAISLSQGDHMIRKNLRWMAALLLSSNLALVAPGTVLAGQPANNSWGTPTTTPIKHVVVIFQENVSFDHYFATYPIAQNPQGEPSFQPRQGFLFPTPTVNGLTPSLLTNNPNSSNPFRLDHSQASTCDQNHNYGAEQSAFDMGLMDKFPETVGVSESAFCDASFSYGHANGSLVMGYFDGNTVTALWNYAQNFAMSDNSYGTTFGPSTPGVINLVSGQTNGVTATLNGTGDEVSGGSDNSLTVVGDPDPLGDVCSNPTRNQVTMGSKNIGDLLSAAGVTWGSFMGGFNLSIVNPNGTTGCSRSSVNAVDGVATNDYIPHHSFFNYYTSTANPAHTRPASDAEIGNAGP